MHALLPVKRAIQKDVRVGIVRSLHCFAWLHLGLLGSGCLHVAIVSVVTEWLGCVLVGFGVSVFVYVFDQSEGRLLSVHYRTFD